MQDVYVACPVLEDASYKLRLVKREDASDLLQVYSDVLAVPFFNGDNCNGDNFYYPTIKRMQEAIAYWLMEYNRRGFVRWSIYDKSAGKMVGTIELFKRIARDAYDGVIILRLDVRSDYETKDRIYGILSLLLSKAYDMFDGNRIATKAFSKAKERRDALAQLHFKESKELLIGHDGTGYTQYWVRDR